MTEGDAHVIRMAAEVCKSDLASSMVGEFMGATIPKYCDKLAKNQYHNGHPDLVPKGKFTGDSLQHGTEGIEIKASV